jgi:hypothetical protein
MDDQDQQQTPDLAEQAEEPQQETAQENQTEDQAIGRVSATERVPTTSEEFSFWLRPGFTANPFDIIEAEHVNQSKTYGLVKTLEHATDAQSHLANYISNNFGEMTDEPNTPRQGATTAKVTVMKNTKEMYMPLQSESRVKFPDRAGIEIALGIDVMPEQDRIAAGQIKLSNSTEAIAYIDKKFTIGPEAAHINISGISGLATKTSYAMFLMQSMMQKLDHNEVAVVILNVKHGDLLHLDEENAHLEEADKTAWTDIGLECKPFENVSYYLPRKDAYGPNSQNPPAQGKYKIYAYDLLDTVDKLELLFSNVPDAHATLESMIGELVTRLQNPTGPWANVHTWHELLNSSPLVNATGQAQRVGDVLAASVGRFRRQLRRIVETRQSGIFVGNKTNTEVSLGNALSQELAGGNTYVVDIAQLNDEEQTLVFGDVMKSIYRLFSEADEAREATLPKKVLIFVDELNKFAPAREGTSPIIEQILDIAERGRSLGLILISAQQFLSAVHPRVTGNSATKILGRTGASEISTPSYRFLDNELKQTLTRLGKGELILQHPIYSQPVKITFPRPCYKQD